MHPGSVKIFAEDNTPRLSYTAGLILGDMLGLEWEIITRIPGQNDFPLINYSSRIIPGAFTIKPSGLLSEKGVRNISLSVETWKGLPVFFNVASGSDIPFDIFSASFYLVSRYEEYLSHGPDRHGRFAASSSLAYKHGFLMIPVVDLWAREFAADFSGKYPGFVFRFSEYRSLFTSDTDQPYAYLGRGFLRSMLGLISDILIRKRDPAGRLKVLAGSSEDPFAVYDYIIRNLKENNTDAKFFFPVGQRSEYDHNPSWKNKQYRSLIKYLSSSYTAGLHPSYHASGNIDIFRADRERLSVILGRDVNICRFHFLRFKIPGSYKMLVNEGIIEDYSMGYAGEPGFRAGIARPFNFFDISEEIETNLKIVPLQVMDSTLYDYLNLRPENAEDVIFKLIDETKRAGGLFVSLWHNTSLEDSGEWLAWRKLFEKMLKIQQE